MTLKNLLWTMGTSCTMALTQSCVTFHPPQLDNDLLHSAKGRPSEPVAIAFAPEPIFKTAYEYTDGITHSRTVFCIVNRDHDILLRAQEIEGAAHMVTDLKTGQQSAIAIDHDKVVYSEYKDGNPTAESRTVSNAVFAKKELERIKSFILGMPSGNQTVQITPTL